MPLEHSTSDAAVSRNISREMRAGRPQRQAIAIAKETQRQARKTQRRTKRNTRRLKRG